MTGGFLIVGLLGFGLGVLLSAHAPNIQSGVEKSPLVDDTERFRELRRRSK